MKKTKR